jgi:gluconate kinase
VIVAQIDGLSGTGKSTLHEELSRRGHCAIDSDVEFAYFGDPATGLPTAIMIRSNWLWDLHRLRDFCERSEESPVFICGGAMNQDECADLFTHRFLLCIDDATMRQRLLTRTANDFGKDPRELTEQLELNRCAEAAGRRAGWIIVDATQPISDVADAIVRGVE